MSRYDVLFIAYMMARARCSKPPFSEQRSAYVRAYTCCKMANTARMRRGRCAVRERCRECQLRRGAAAVKSVMSRDGSQRSGAAA